MTAARRNLQASDSAESQNARAIAEPSPGERDNNDRSGLLVSLNFVREPQNCFEGVSINVRVLANSDAIGNGLAAAVLDSVCNQLVPVWFSDGSNKMLMHPENDVARLVISGEPAPAHLQNEVTAWRERYTVFAATAWKYEQPAGIAGDGAKHSD